jgi:tetratricopeptide (TPR) repeat protein
MSLANRAMLLHLMGRLAAAAAVYRQAVNAQEQLTREFPTVPEYRLLLASIHNNLGQVLSELGRWEEVLAAHERAVVICERLVADNPGVLAYAVNLGISYASLGGALRRNQGKPQAALDYLDRAIRTLEPVLAKNPQLAHAQQCLCFTHGYRALALNKLGRPAEAVRDWERAIELGESFKKMTTFRLGRTLSLAQATGQHTKALAEANALADNKSERPVDLYDAACYCAMASAAAKEDGEIATRYANQAMALLRRAVETGQRSVELMKTDPGLDALRPRADFRKLLSEVEEKVKSEK